MLFMAAYLLIALLRVGTTAAASPHQPWSEDGIWLDPEASIAESRPAENVRVFHIRGRHAVAVIASSPDWHDTAKQQRQACREWEPISPFEGDGKAVEANAFSCLFGYKPASALLSDFNAHTAALLKAAFNVSKPCEERPLTGTWGFNPQTFTFETRSWMLALHSGMTEDTFHSDGCEQAPRAPGSDFFTVLSYPPADGVDGWEDGWGGHVEFAPRACEADGVGVQRSATDAAGALKPVLRLAPRPDRLVVFSGQLLHRSTTPTAEAPTTATLPRLARGVRATRNTNLGGRVVTAPAEARWRYTQVMQLYCHNDAYHGPYAHGGGGGGVPGWAGMAIGTVLLLGTVAWRGASRRQAAAAAERRQAVGTTRIVLHLAAAPELLPPKTDARRRAALSKFASDNPEHALRFERAPAVSPDLSSARDPEAQVFSCEAVELLDYIEGGQVEGPMAPRVRFLRLYLMLLIGDDNLLRNFTDSGRFRTTEPRDARRRAALRRIVEGNVAALEEKMKGEGDAKQQLEALRAILEALPSAMAAWLERAWE